MEIQGAMDVKAWRDLEAVHPEDMMPMECLWLNVLLLKTVLVLMGNTFLPVRKDSK
jgi:hypothetical protein